MMIDNQYTFRSRSLSEETGDDARPLYSSTDSNGTQVGNFIVSDFAIVYDFTVDEGTEYVEMFSLIPLEKPVTRENWDELIIYFLDFWMMKLTKTPILPNC